MTRSRLLLPRDGAVRRAALGSALALAGAVGAAGAPAAAWAAPQAELSGDAARARELYRKGREEMTREGHLPQAYVYLKEAWDLQKSFDTAGNLAAVESRLTRFREAAEHATYALAHFPTGGSDAQRKALDEVLSGARTQIGTVTLRVSADGAAVTIDNQPAGQSPFASEIYLEPGQHTFVATLPGCDPARDSVRTERGSTHLITLTLGKCGTGGGGGGIEIRPPLVEPHGPRPLTVAGFVTTGVGLGLGAAFAILSKIKASDADTAALSLGSSPGACAGPSPKAGCASLHDALASHDTFANAAIWTFVGATAVGAGTLIYTFAVPRAPAAVKATGPQVIPVIGPGAAALTVKGTF